MRWLFFIWVLSMPFYQFSVVGSFSVDNLLAPVLLLAWLAQITIGGGSVATYQANNIVKSIIVAVFYFSAHIIGLIGTQDAIWHSAYTAATSMLYFILPILFIRSIDDLNSFKNAIIVIAIIASISGLLSALGIIELEFARQAESRIGVAELQKSIGVFSSYGDVGILLSLALLVVIARYENISRIRSCLMIALLVIVCLIAIISMQSRNIVLTIIAAVVSYGLIGRLVRISNGWNYILYALIIIAATISVMAVTLFYEPLLKLVQSIGGTKEAAGTVAHRLEQYGVMWDLVKNRVWVGIEPHVYERYMDKISLTHNIWLKELVQGGVITVVAMLTIFWRALIIQVDNYRRGCMSDDALVFLSSVLGMLVATQFYPGGTLIFWCILGACSAMPFKAKKVPVKKQKVNQLLHRAS